VPTIVKVSVGCPPDTSEQAIGVGRIVDPPEAGEQDGQRKAVPACRDLCHLGNFSSVLLLTVTNKIVGYPW
jgi:hypothetical protein